MTDRALAISRNPRRAALLCCAVWLLCQAPAHAAGNAPGSHLWPPEPAYQVTVFEITCTDLKDCCGVHRDCGDWYQRPRDPAPVPLPTTATALLLGLAGLGIIKRKRT